MSRPRLLDAYCCAGGAPISARKSLSRSDDTRRTRMTSPDAHDIMSPMTYMDMMTVDDYASLHDRTPRTVRRWLAAGRLPGAAQDSHGAWSIPATCPPPALLPHTAARTIPGETVHPDPAPDGYGTIAIPLPVNVPARRAAQVARRPVHDPMQLLTPESPVFVLPASLFVSPAQVAALTDNVSARTIARMCAAGEIRAHRHGRRWLIPRGEIAKIAGVTR